MVDGKLVADGQHERADSQLAALRLLVSGTPSKQLRAAIASWYKPRMPLATAAPNIQVAKKSERKAAC